MIFYLACIRTAMMCCSISHPNSKALVRSQRDNDGSHTMYFLHQAQLLILKCAASISSPKREREREKKRKRKLYQLSEAAHCRFTQK